MKLGPLFALLKELEGRDIDKMSDDEGRRFCELGLDRFRVVAAPIPGIALGQHIADGYDWHVEGGKFFAGDYFGSLKMIHTGKMEAAIGEPEKLRMAAALFPDEAFEVALFGDFHRAGGLQSTARLSVSIGTDGRDGLTRMATALRMVGKELSTALACQAVVAVTIEANESSCPRIENPKDVAKAFEEVASAARKAAREDEFGDGDDDLTELVELKVDVAAKGSDSADCMERLLQVLGAVFVVISAR